MLGGMTDPVTGDLVGRADPPGRAPDPDGRLDAPGTPPFRAGGRRRGVFAADYVGPNWFTAVMGTAILATCTEYLAQFAPGLHAVAVLVLVLAWVLLTGIGATFVSHAVRDPQRFRATFTDPAVAPFYGALAMGLLSAGAATLVVAGRHLPTTATSVAWGLWITGTLLGVLTALVYPARLIAAGPERRGTPTPVWALPVVPPMVSAAGGAPLAATLPPAGASAMLVLSTALFVFALCLATVVFGIAYGHLALGNALPLQASPAIWIPLGFAGQSTTAANFLLAEAGGAVPPEALEALRAVVVAYSVVALGSGVVSTGIALRVTVGALRRGMTFSLGWWSFTFPVGTMSLGVFALGATLELPWLAAVSAVICACLAGTVGLCLVRSARFWATGRL